MKNTYKFDKLSELITEIDQVIEDLTAKKKEILDKIDSETIKMLYAEKGEKYSSLFNEFNKKAGKEEFKFTSYATIIDKENYDLLAKAAEKYGQTISTFLKNKYFLNFINDKNKANTYANDYASIIKTLKDRVDPKNIKPENKKTVGLALNQNDSERLEKAARMLEIKPRELIRHLTNLFIYDQLIAKEIRPDYIPEDANIPYIRCQSTNVKAYGYDDKNHLLYVEFGGGRRYKYFDCPKKIYEDMTKAESKGRFVNKVLTPNFKYEKVN